MSITTSSLLPLYFNCNMLTPTFVALATLLFSGLATAQHNVVFNCANIPPNRRVYFQMHYDSNTNNKAARRVAAGCPTPNHCNTAPPAAGRTTANISCDEYPFASTHGVGNGGWYSNTGATNRCVSQAECNSQGGSLSAFYQSFGQVDQTPFGVQVTNYGNLPFCTNVNQPSDGQFATGVRPPVRRDVELAARNDTISVALHEYKTAGNHTIRSLTGPLAVGDKIFVPNEDWQTHPKAAAVLAKRDGPNDICTGTTAQLEAASKLATGELGTYDTVVKAL
ncbi:hypothetical protein HWV62_39922 [Athelia sp. TMB]|nr:hypothetical protein HWV62_39922 [Athelia sp. TMB]